MKTCFFIGHRDAPQEILPRLEAAVERHICEYGVTEFVVGHYGNFDAMAAQAVIRAKEKHASVSLYQLRPYKPRRAVRIPDGHNGIFYPLEHVPTNTTAIPLANREMMRRCDYLIAYAWHEGNSKGFLEYAMMLQAAQSLTVINLAKE